VASKLREKYGMMQAGVENLPGKSSGFIGFSGDAFFYEKIASPGVETLLVYQNQKLSIVVHG
jgi:hypothetical protein